MIVRIDESFVKDISKIKDKKLRSKVADYIEQVRSSDKVSEITGIKKLTGLKRSIVSGLEIIGLACRLKTMLYILSVFYTEALFTSIFPSLKSFLFCESIAISFKFC
jgi:hypothetical protein